MNSLERYMLLASLSFFFGCMAIALVGLYSPMPHESYMYSPAKLEKNQINPVDSRARQYSTLPESVLHYPSAQPDTGKDNSILCYLAAEYDALTRKLMNEHDATLAARANLESEKIEIYAAQDGEFSVFVIGPDAIGQQEACEVARGDGWRVLNP